MSRKPLLLRAVVLGAALLAGCAHPAKKPAAELSLQPVAGDGWATYEAVLAGTYTDPAAGYDGAYPTKHGRTKFRIEVRVPRYAGKDTVGPSLIAHVPGQPPARQPYVVVRIYVASTRLTVNPSRIVPRGPCGPQGTPPSSVSVGVHVDADGVRSRPPLPPPTPQAQPQRGGYETMYTRIYVTFDTEPGQLASCTLDFTAAIGDGKLAIPPLTLVSDTARQYSPSMDEAPGGE